MPPPHPVDYADDFAIDITTSSYASFGFSGSDTLQRSVKQACCQNAR
jgi:hypothetical protein